MVPEAVGIGCPKLCHSDVPRVERRYEPFDGAPFPRSVPAFEDDADRWSETTPAELTAIDQSEMEEPSLGSSELPGFFFGRDPQGEVDVGQARSMVSHC
jgi:hypothetical protein